MTDLTPTITVSQRKHTLSSVQPDRSTAVTITALLDHNDLYHMVSPYNLFHTGTPSLILQKNLDVTNTRKIVF